MGFSLHTLTDRHGLQYTNRPIVRGDRQFGKWLVCLLDSETLIRLDSLALINFHQFVGPCSISIAHGLLLNNRATRSSTGYWQCTVKSLEPSRRSPEVANEERNLIDDKAAHREREKSTVPTMNHLCGHLLSIMTADFKILVILRASTWSVSHSLGPTSILSACWGLNSSI